MPVLLRLTKQTVWSGEAPDAARREGALETFRRRDEDTDGVSVFEVKDERERELVIAAIACMRNNDRPVDVIEVSREVLETYGKVAPSDGTTPIPAVNRMHRSLDWDGWTLERLAADLFEARLAARRFKVPEVRTAVRALDPDDVEGEDAKEFVRRQRAKVAK